MDPITAAVMAALGAGALSGLGKAGEDAIAQAYKGLKSLLRKKFGEDSRVARSVIDLEAKPDSRPRAGMVGKALAEANATRDPELLRAAEDLMKLIGARAPDVSVSDSQNVAIASGNATQNFYGAPPPIDPSEKMREDVAYVVSRLESRRVLSAAAPVNVQIWRFAFESLRQLREVLADTDAHLRVRGPNDVKTAVRFMLKAVLTFLSRHETSYQRYMSDHGGFGTGWERVEQDWLEEQRSRPAYDLLLLRRAVDPVVRTLNGYAETGQSILWDDPWSDSYWAHWEERQH